MYIKNYIIHNLKLQMNSVIILASGTGKRFKSKIPKQFTKLRNQMIVEYSIEAFSNNDNIDEVILVCSEEWQNNLKNIYNKIEYTSGGCTRLESSYLGLLKCNINCINVLIHDAARPFVSQKVINDSLAYLDKFDAAIPTINSDDSLIDEKTLKYSSRDKIKMVQTPQAFDYKKILESYTKLADEHLFDQNIFNDDLSVLLKYNTSIKIKLFDGNKTNFKITNKDDLNKANFFVKQC